MSSARRSAFRVIFEQYSAFSNGVRQFHRCATAAGYIDVSRSKNARGVETPNLNGTLA
jgi:hypothetical protein